MLRDNHARLLQTKADVSSFSGPPYLMSRSRLETPTPLLIHTDGTLAFIPTHLTEAPIADRDRLAGVAHR